MQEAIAEARKALDAQAPKAELDTAGQKLAAALQAFQQAAAAAGASDEPTDGAAPDAAADDDVIDADFKPAS